VRIHVVSSGWSALHGLIELRRLLRGIGIELIEESGLDTQEQGEALDRASEPSQPA
jgi:hypothetical protein